MRAAGIYPDIDIDVYHKEEGISSSGISLILDCPRRYWHAYVMPRHPIDPKEVQKINDKFRMGRAVHMYVLEPEKFMNTFYLMKDVVNLTTKLGKEQMHQALEKANGREVLRKGDWDEIIAMGDSVKAHSLWAKMGKSHVEHSLYWDMKK